MLGTVKYVLGDLVGARRHLEQALAGYSTTDLRQAAARFDDAIRFQHDGQVEACVFLSGVLWLQGLPHQAIRMAERSLDEAEATGHGTSQCLALALGTCTLALWTGDLRAAADYTRRLVDLSTRNGHSHWTAYGARFRRVIALRGGDVGGIAEIGQSDAHLRNLACCTELAEAFAKAGRSTEGLAVLDEFEAQSPELGAFTPEFLRIRGELLLLQGTPDAAQPSADLFKQALEFANRHGALSLELRAATSLARLLHDQGRQAQAAACLPPIYDRFTEGFDTADLIAAKRLMEELNGPAR
jgi:tetratricopeptide (TPR) repeat protein